MRRVFAFPAALLLAAFATAQINPDLGAGGNGLRDWAFDKTYADMIRQSRGFEKASGTGKATINADGWPTEDCYTILQTVGRGRRNELRGTYKLRFRGQANVDLGWTIGTKSVTNVVYTAATDTTTADLNWDFDDTATDGYFVLYFRNVRNVRDIRVARPGLDPANLPLFTTEFLDHARRFSCIRFMDWTETNFSPVKEWAERTPPTWPSAASKHGVAWEDCIDLCNRLDRDAWINVPAMASDDYVRKLAQLFKARLEPGRKLYVEYSNEVWNFQFDAWTQNMNAALAEVDAGNSPLMLPGENVKDSNGDWVYKWDFVYRRIAKRLLDIRNLFGEVYGPAAMNSTIRPIFANQIGNVSTFERGLDWMMRRGIVPGDVFWGMAGAPYFNSTAVENRTDATTAQVISALSDDIENWFTPVSREGGRAMERAVFLSYFHRLKWLAYEGGPDTFGGNNVAAKRAASLDPSMREMCNRYLRRWYEAGGGLFNWFVMGAGNWESPYGTWTLLESISGTSPKLTAMDDTLNAPKPEPTWGVPVPGTVDARRVAGANADWQTANPYARYLGRGSKLDYLVRAARGGGYRLRFSASQLTARPGTFEVWVNGRYITRVNAPRTPGAETFRFSDWTAVKLNRGLNCVRIVVPQERPYNVRSLELVDVVPIGATNLTATNGGSRRIALSWTKAPEGAVYDLYRGTAPNVSLTTPLVRGLRRTSFVDRTGLVNGTAYWYRLVARTVAGPLPASNEVTATPAAVEMVRNGGFETGVFAPGWFFGGDSHVVRADAARTGAWGYRQNGGYHNLVQSLTGLAAGRPHTLRVWVRSQIATARVAVNVNGGRIAANVPQTATWTLVSIPFVPNGATAEITLFEDAGRLGFTWADDWSVTED